MTPPPARRGGRPPSKQVPGPKYDLVRDVLPVARLAQIGKTRAVRLVQERLGFSEPEAERFVIGKLCALTTGAYVHTVEMDYDSGRVIADVYGVIDEHGGWYLKLYKEHGRIQVTSCHGPDSDLHCKSGTVVPKED